MARKSTIVSPKPRERILEAACALFGRHGVQGVGVDEIAQAADSNKMTLYRHFGSKENLAVACLRAVIDEIDAKWREIEMRGEPARALDDWISRMARGCTGADSRSELIFAVFRQAREDAAARPLLDSFMTRHRKRLAGVCHKSGVADGEMLGAALVLLAHGARANPWGLNAEDRSALFSSLAGLLTKLFKTGPRKGQAALSRRKSISGKRRLAEAREGTPKPRDRILAAGCVLFNRHGVEEASVDEIAQTADSNKMTLYRHFGSKENLAVQCFKAALAEAEAILKAIETENAGDAPRQLDGFIDLMADALAGSDWKTEMIGMAMQAMRNEAAGQAMIRDFDLWDRKRLARICRALDIAHPDALSDTLLLVVHGASANPWGLGRERLAAQYFSLARMIVALFRSHPAKAKARNAAGRRVVRKKHAA